MCSVSCKVLDGVNLSESLPLLVGGGCRISKIYVTSLWFLNRLLNLTILTSSTSCAAVLSKTLDLFFG